MVGAGETFLAGKWLGRFLYLGEPGEPDERNACPFTAFFGTFLSREKGLL